MKCTSLPFYRMIKRWTLTMLLLALLMPGLSAKASQVIRIGFNDVKLIQTLERIEAVTPFKFIYNREDIDANKRVNIREQDWTINELLEEVSNQASLSFKIVDGIIAVAPKGHAGAATAARSFAEVKGRVTDKSGMGLPGASVKVKGGTTGAATNGTGHFTIQAAPTDVLVISYTGYLSQEVVAGNGGPLNIVLEEDTRALSEVVVTALGIRKEKKALGYSVTEVKGSELTQAREVNIANSLVGKVAGVNVNSVSGGPGAATNVTIRGISSLSGSNQPLYVINGVPMSNESVPITSRWSNVSDQGDGIGNINPDDIESMSVLKGAAASALYGSRAKAGVILITTKSGKGKGTVEFNSNFVLDKIINLTDFQYEYGNGSNGAKPANRTAAFNTGNASWGAKLDGSNAIQFDGVERPYVAQKNNLKNFYNGANTFTNTISFSKGLDNNGGIRFSASDMNNRAVTPSATLKRQTFSLNVNYNVTKRLAVDARANYIIEKANNRPILNDGAGNSNFQVMFLPTSVNVNDLKPGFRPDGRELQFVDNIYATNPWFAAEKFINNTNRNRFIGSGSLRYTFDNGLYLQGRAGLDAYNNRNTFVVPSGTAYLGPLVNANVTEASILFSEINIDGLAGMPIKVNKDLTITPQVGANLRKVSNETSTIGGTTLNMPFAYDVSNIKSQSTSYSLIRQEVQSVYGTLEIAYKGLLYLNASARNDWFSTLAPSNKLDVFYPAVSGSFIFSELAHPSWLSFGKLRAGYAVVGAATDPYLTMLNYGVGLQNGASAFISNIGGKTLGRVINTSIPSGALRPSKASEIEVGAELRFLNNRIGVDVTWYNKTSKDEIVQAPASVTSGYSNVILNIGKLRNTGVELLLTGTPYQTKNFTWTTSLNGSMNNNTVLELAAGQSSLLVAESRVDNVSIANMIGLPVNQIIATDYKRDESGKVLVDANGAPLKGESKNYGSGYHKWTGGWNNEFSYKRFNFSFLIDGKFGGKVFAATDYYAYGFGLHKATLEGRDKKYGSANAEPQTYYTKMRENVTSLFVQDASFIKLRQVTLGYTFPSRWFNNVIQSATLSLVGRNLLILMKKTDNIDPESAYSNVAQGLELGGVPPTRSYGFNLNVKF
ncbi:SusC/RagA family TonB-linked outer membrane protein [Chitinophaga nivalis]|uniref:SusC/RagA family TonB-linked outer membrane protein n=1 Tax=Chitinophaga nivalis TaxID=2991709 RepID=A0ABT3IQZ2_9BACT|nr:SusC/RagA family TonB-linked outer membrane protein [Chitinophaga nivalis]MCW3463908.1 SusC/RagA family TonB-linked outer membrane protein [Chitinophaga nivalis]MCW3486402.1 SusC/RagA family TonB-linked outer membrane protein [Chitinophaga nivalis]